MMRGSFTEEKKESSKVSVDMKDDDEDLKQLRSALQQEDAAAKTALAKSDAVILELRSSVRQLKRQLEKVQAEKAALEQTRRSSNDSVASAADGRVGELQTELDKAHAQLLTADMVRKELEDTLEAEQYTWELKLQDQERTIQQLEQDCANLVDDLDQCRKQWKEDEDAWTNDVEELRMKLDQTQRDVEHWKGVKSGNQDSEQLQRRIVELEQERGELQGCLDEALKELEAVDAELQGDDATLFKEENMKLKKALEENSGDVVEQLQHLYRWLLEKDGFDDSAYKMPSTPREIIHAIKTHLENSPSNDKDLVATRKQVAELEAQLFAYKGDLKAREESSAELRASLKEAVGVLNPLQDLLAKTEKEKEELERELENFRNESKERSTTQTNESISEFRQQLAEKEDEIEALKGEIQSLEVELSKAKVMAASQYVSPKKSNEENEALVKARKEVKARRAAESNLQDMLKSARNQYQELQEHNSRVEAMNTELQNELGKGQSPVSSQRGLGGDDVRRFQLEIERRDDALRSMEQEIQRLHNDLSSKQAELNRARSEMDNGSYMGSQAGSSQLQMKLKAAKKELQHRKEAERALNKSLKEALDLLRPLQSHLEEAEQEKQELERELMRLQEQGGTIGHTSSMRSTDTDSKMLTELQNTVKRLEKENSQLHNALEDMSQNQNVSHLSGISNLSQKEESRLREDVVEMKSRYEVTQRRLEEALNQSQKLKAEINKKNESETALLEEVIALRDRLKKAENGLQGSDRTPSNDDIVKKNTAANASPLRKGQAASRSRVPYQLV